eukprot:TRINITY_DN2936_c0_g1_i2.p1 TRINITY_DN2936_c0_g1~~TRINITY_DN2936_c0_g1_i2.p1  ORF type:complete len:869 (-),score=182.80 TRINITY_DN2936_c0_g1_i2:122-2692(-)
MVRGGVSVGPLRSLIRNNPILQHRNSRLGCYILIFIYFLYSTSSAFGYFMLRQQNSTPGVNEHCQSINPPQYCKSDRQFNKFLMFVTDCWPIEYAKDVFEHYKDKGAIYYIDLPGAKYSHAIYTSHLTGQLPTNYKGDPIKGDHLIRSMLRKPDGPKLRYIGPEWSFLAILGKDNYDTFFKEVNIQEEALDVQFTHTFPFLFQDNLFALNYYNSLKSSGQSMIAHSGVFDHVQHGEHLGLGPLGEEFPRSERMAKTMNTDMKNMRDWIDNNPDYLLILLSDHGVDEYGPQGYRMHGIAQDGNEPFMLIYNPKLNHIERRIDVVDVASTLAYYFGVDIPLNSIGIPSPDIDENDTLPWGPILQKNLAQISFVAKDRGVSMDQSQIDYFLSRDQLTLDEVLKLRSLLMDLKNVMYQAYQKSPMLQIAIYSFIALVIVIGVIFYNDTMPSLRSPSRIVTSIYHLLITYGLMLLQLLFCWWNWKIAHDGGYVFRTLSPGLALVSIVHLRLSSESGAITPGETYLFKNEQTNLFLIFMSSCFVDLLLFFDALYIVPEIALILTLYGGIRYYRLYRPLQRMERNLFGICIMMAHMYSYTAESEAFFLGSFHILALVPYIMGAIVFPIYFIFTKRVEDMLLPLHLILYLLFKHSAVGRMVLLMFNMQYLRYLLPAIRQLRIRIANLQGSLDQKAIFWANLAHQVVIVYAINQAFFTFMFGFGDKINLDVHPFTGRIGMRAYDHLPALSAFLMTFHKYGIFSLFCVFAFRISKLRMQKDDIDKDKDDRIISQSNNESSNWLTDCVTLSLIMLHSLTTLGMYIMFSAATRHHPLEQSVATTLITGTMGFVYSFLHVADKMASTFL